METWLFEILRAVTEVSLSFILPSVGICLFITIIVGLLQAFTNIKDEAIAYAGKLLGVGLVIIIFAGGFSESLRELAIKAWSGGFTP